MKNNKNGFTLIELLVTIVLMISILAIAIISITKVNDRFKERSFESVKDEVITAAKEYFNVNTYYLESLGQSTVKVSIGELVNNDYLNSVTNPKTGKKLSYCDYVEVTKNENNKLTYTYNPNETGETSCDNHSYVEVTPVENVGTLQIEFIGEQGNNNWYKRNSYYNDKDETNDYVEDKTIDYDEDETIDLSRISPGVVVKLTADTTNSNYHVQSMIKITEDDETGEELTRVNLTQINEGNSNINVFFSAYDSQTFATSTTGTESESGRNATYKIFYTNETNDASVIKKVKIEPLKVDIDPPSCKISTFGAKVPDKNNAYYCLSTAFGLVNYKPFIIYSFNDNESGLLEDDQVNNFENYAEHSKKNITGYDSLSCGDILQNSKTNKISKNISDIAGNQTSCEEKIVVEKFTVSDIVDKVIEELKESITNNTFYCAETKGESTQWTNKTRTITQTFRTYGGSSDTVTKDFTSSAKTGTITRVLTSCDVNVYVDKTPPKLYSFDKNNVYYVQKVNGKSIGKRKLEVYECEGGKYCADVCFYNISGTYNIEFSVSASDDLSGVNPNSWTFSRSTTAGSGGCLISSGENTCYETRSVSVSDYAGNRATLVTLQLRIGYIYNDLFSRPKRDYDRFCDKYAPVNKNNYKKYLKD